MERYRFQIVAVFLYTVAHCGLFFAPNSIYWDDWVLYQTSPETVLSTFEQAGSPLKWAGHLHNLLMPLGPWIYKTLTFVFFLVAGLRLEVVLRKFRSLTESERFVFITLFLILPFNMARIAAIDLPYALNVFLFFTAWSLIDTRRKTAILLFFVSFNTNSLLMFYTLPLLDLLYRSRNYRNIRSLLSFGRKHIVLLIIPFLYFSIKVLCFKPFGAYAGYTEEYNLLGIPFSISDQLRDLGRLNINWTLTLGIMPIMFGVAFRLFRNFNTTLQPQKTRMIFAVGLLALVLGLFPYWILGLTPTFREWTSRHQLLMPLGAALTVGSLIIARTRSQASLIFALMASASISYTLQTYADFYADWKKQEALIEAFQGNDKIRNAKLILFDDRTESINAIQREYRFYEWNGLMTYAYGNEARFGIRPSEQELYSTGHYDQYFSADYKARDHKRETNRPALLVFIQFRKPEQSPSFWRSLRPNLKIDVKTF